MVLFRETGVTEEMSETNAAKKRKCDGSSPANLDELVSNRAKPFVKWVGGKGQLLPQLLKKRPKVFRRYFEPFVGGGAFFFALNPSRGYISDVNEELINTYQVVRDDVDSLVKLLRKHRYDEEYFYAVRDWDRKKAFRQMSRVKRAARFIYLNKTCFNGLHRVNSKGHFNVPFGDYKNPTIVDETNLYLCSGTLKGVDIEVAGYMSVEEKVKKGDFVYFDPPYAPLTATANFTSYTANGFGSCDQEQLRDLCVRLDKRGVHVMVSNSSAPLILDLYKKFNLELVDAKRSINSRGNSRGPVKEVIVTNY